MPLFKNKKKFSETGLGKFLKEKAPAILDKVGDRFPAIGLIKDLITNSPDLDPKDKDLAIKMAEYELKEMEAVTSRWQADMQSDSWLSKNVRPLVMLYLLFVLTVMVVASFWEIKIPIEYTDLIKWLLLTVFGAFFGGRTVEKIRSMKK